MKPPSFPLPVLTGLLLATLPAAAANWDNWRGPDHNGSSPERGLPAKFSPTENVKWMTRLPGTSAATPVIHGDTVFISSANENGDSLQAMALDRKTGQVRWNHTVGTGYRQDDRSNFSAPSPATDGTLVVFFYGNGEMAAFNFAGRKLWQRNLQKDHGEFAFQWTFSTSPLLHEGTLYMQVLQRDVEARGRGKAEGNESYLLAINPRTGKDLWKVARPSEAVAESREAFSTPIPFQHGRRAELVIVGGDDISGHDPKTGRELWRWGTWNPTRIGHWRLVPSPVAGDGLLLACGPKDAPITAVKAGRSGRLGDADVAWQSTVREVTSDVPTPLFHDGKFYVLNGKKKLLLCVNPGDGKVIWQGELGGFPVYEASPTAADGKIYLMNHKGDVTVVKAGGNSFEKLHSVNMADKDDSNLRASVAISQGNLFIRTGTKLYCVGK